MCASCDPHGPRARRGSRPAGWDRESAAATRTRRSWRAAAVRADLRQRGRSRAPRVSPGTGDRAESRWPDPPTGSPPPRARLPSWPTSAARIVCGGLVSQARCGNGHATVVGESQSRARRRGRAAAVRAVLRQRGRSRAPRVRAGRPIARKAGGPIRRQARPPEPAPIRRQARQPERTRLRPPAAWRDAWRWPSTGRPATGAAGSGPSCPSSRPGRPGSRSS